MWIEGRALYREGRAAAPRSVTVSLDLRGLTIRGLSGDAIGHWPFGALVRLRGEPLAIGRRPPRRPDPVPDAPPPPAEGADARVEIADPAVRAAFEAALRTIPRAEDFPVPRSFLMASAAVLVSLAVAGYAAVALLSAVAGRFAPMIPTEVVEVVDGLSREDALAALGTAETRRCTGIEGGIALGRLADRLAIAGEARPMDLDVAVYRSDLVTAVALPGGGILLTDALLAAVRTPDAFAGVLADEIGRVHLRQGLTRLLEEGGVPALAALLAGRPEALPREAFRALSAEPYGREAVLAADGFAVEAVAAAGGDPKALGAFLLALEARTGPAARPLRLLATRPVTRERLAAIEAAAGATVMGDGPLVSDEDWTAIREVCG